MLVIPLAKQISIMLWAKGILRDYIIVSNFFDTKLQNSLVWLEFELLFAYFWVINTPIETTILPHTKLRDTQAIFKDYKFQYFTLYGLYDL
jgi:hypothetical protein